MVHLPIARIFVLIVKIEVSHYHQVLGVPRGATKREIKLAYRRLALEWHPDVNASAQAHQKFTEISLAYKTLMNLSESAVNSAETPPQSREQIRKERRKKAEEKIRQANEFIAKQRLLRKIRILQSPYLWVYRLTHRLSFVIMCFLPSLLLFLLFHAFQFGIEAFLISIVIGLIAIYYPVISSYDYYKEFKFVEKNKI